MWWGPFYSYVHLRTKAYTVFWQMSAWGPKEVNLLLKLQLEKGKDPISSAPKWIYSSGKISIISSNNNFKAANDLPCSIHTYIHTYIYIYISGMNAQVQHHIITNILSHSLHWFPMATKDCRDSGQLHALIVSLHNWCAFRWEHICPSLTTGGTLGVIVPHCGQLHALIVSLHKDHCMHSTDVLNIFGYFHLIGQKYHKVSTRSIQQYK